MYKRDLSIMRLARLMSRKSNARNFKMGAVVAKGRKILGLGCNDVVKTHPKSNAPYGRIHAELSAMLNAKMDVAGATLYIFRAGNKETPLLAKPCQHCRDLIKTHDIKFIVYSNYGGFVKVPIAKLMADEPHISRARKLALAALG